ncbi:hypothetical protein GQ53DRAFT_845345 [Thozetella sp. PMI_491]|nr:hypothetical protein GQ53DRAFT_845345 [Thozetella sp. PMI_491]
MVVEDVTTAYKAVWKCVQDLERGVPGPGDRHSIWLDDRRSESPEKPGELQNERKLLTPTALFRYLKDEACHAPDQRCSYRRIYICDLEQWEFLSLVSTATFQNAPAIREAVCSHFTFQPALEVKIQESGYGSFILCFHIPSLLLRQTEGPPPPRRASYSAGPPRDWTDLSFLGLDVKSPNHVWGFFKSGFTCVMTGSGEWQWVAYGLGDSEADGFLFELDDEELENYDYLGCGDFESETPKSPIRRPREYCLRILTLRMKKFMYEYRNLVGRLDRQIKRHIAKHPFTRDRHTAQEKEELRELFGWTVKTKEVLREICELHTEWMQEWDAFVHPDTGDIRYFRDVSRENAELARRLEEIHHSVYQVRRLKTRLTSMTDRCRDYANALELCLGVELKGASDSNINLTSTVIYVLTPIATVATIFSMNQAALPFELNPRNVGIALLVLWMLTPIVQILRPAILYSRTVARSVGAACYTALNLKAWSQMQKTTTKSATETRKRKPGDEEQGTTDLAGVGPATEMTLLNGETLVPGSTVP